MTRSAVKVPLSTSRVCTKTGLAITAGPVHSYRIARQSFGPLSPRLRPDGGDASEWSRYDTPGRTLYSATDKLTTFMEMLAPYRTIVHENRRALQPVADVMGIALDDLWSQIVREWDEDGKMKASWLPRTFREGRSMFTLRFPAGSWIDITAIDTISAIHELFDGEFPTSEGTLREPLTLSHLTGDDRILTTAIATMLRNDVELDDGSLPLGIRFTSKHGHPAGKSEHCWAYWMRNVDSGLTEPTEVLGEEAIEEDDRDLTSAQRHCKIKVR